MTLESSADVSSTIRVARPADGGAIAALTRQLGYDVEEAAVAARLARILDREDQQVFIAEDRGRPVGWVHALLAEYIEADPFVVIGGLVVDRGHRRHGLGRRLMAAAEEWAKTRRCSIVRLWSSSARTAAHRFYQALGYTHVKTQYSFVKALDPSAQHRVQEFVPRVEP